MPKTVLITGASSGIGRATAEYFAARGWQVAATMRHPEQEAELAKRAGIKLYRLDVTDSTTVTAALQDVLKDFQTLDVVVNNAGYGAVGVFEKATDTEIRAQFDTNVFGVMNVVREILPLFRKQKKGMIITVTSVGGLVTFPLYSVYHATKWALEGFIESLAFELRPFNIVLKNVEPGAIKTDFYGRSMKKFLGTAMSVYDAYEQAALGVMQKTGEHGPGPEVVAETIFKAATDGSNRLRYPVGGKAPLLAWLKRVLPNTWFFALVRSVVEKNIP